VKDPEGEGHKAAKKKVADMEVCGVAKVLGISKLRNNYKPHEAKRQLCDSYDLFCADARVLPILPKLLGKSFFKNKSGLGKDSLVSIDGINGDMKAN
jgi:ribosome biogenesis protein UTP30